MEKVVVMPPDVNGGRKVLVGGVEVPGVSDVSLFVNSNNIDSVTLTIPVCSFESKMIDD